MVMIITAVLCMLLECSCFLSLLPSEWTNKGVAHSRRRCSQSHIGNNNNSPNQTTISYFNCSYRINLQYRINQIWKCQTGCIITYFISPTFLITFNFFPTNWQKCPHLSEASYLSLGKVCLQYESVWMCMRPCVYICMLCVHAKREFSARCLNFCITWCSCCVNTSFVSPY